MIVKNESAVIRRCLASVIPIVDYWVIVDTGSTDGTQQIVRDFLKDSPGELHEHKWVDFAHNRNKALKLASGKADYIFFIDADETLIITQPIDKNGLCKSFYMMKSIGTMSEHYRIQIINGHPGWKWDGVLHERIVNSQEMGGEILENAWIDFRPCDGHRFRDPDKFLHDAALLEKALANDPTNSRNVFYLGQSYLNAQKYERALKNFQKRAGMPGEPGETFLALFCIGYLQEQLNRDEEEFVESYWKAHAFDPNRIEPLEKLSGYFLRKGWPLLSYLLAGYALSLSKKIELGTQSIRGDSLQMIWADAAYAIGKNDEARKVYRELIALGQISSENRKRINSRLSGDAG